MRGGYPAVKRRHRYAQISGTSLGGTPLQKFLGRRYLTEGYPAFTSADPPSLSSSLKPCGSSLGNRFSFHLGRRSYRVKEVTARGRGVAAIGKVFELNLLFGKLGNKINRALNGLVQTVELPDHEDVAPTNSRDAWGGTVMERIEVV